MKDATMAVATPCYRVILVGEYGVGKSSLFRRFVEDKFLDLPGPVGSLGLDHEWKPYTFGTDIVKLELWDTAGIERFATMSSSYYSSAHAAILCFALNNRESFGLLSQHLLDTAMHSRTAKIFVCGSKLDCVQESDTSGPKIVTDQEISEFSQSCGQAVSGSYKVSSKTGEGVAEMFQHIASVLYSNIYDKFDPTRVKVYEHKPVADSSSRKCCN